MEDLTGRYLKQLKHSGWFSRFEPHIYLEITRIVDRGMVMVKHPEFGDGNAMDTSRFISCGEFELMPVGWKPGNPVVNQYQIY